MTIGSGVPYNEHTGNGVATTFSYGFTLLDEGDLVVTVDDVTTSAYTVTGVGEAAGGTVVFDTAPASSAAVLLRRVIALVRATEYQSNGDLQAETINDDFDRPWMAIQELSAQIGGGVRVPYPEQIDELPAAADRADRLLAFDSLGQPVAIAGADSGSAAALALDLISSATAAKGAGLVSADMALTTYAAQTVGWFLSALLGRTAAEISASVTPTNYAYPPGDVRRYGAAGDDSTNCTAAFTAAFAQWNAGGAVIRVPRGIYRVVLGFTLTSRVVMRGDGRFLSWIKAIGFAVDSSIITMTGTSGVPINGWSISGIGFTSDNLQPRALTQTWCTNGELTDSYFYDLYRGWVGDHSFLNEFNVAVYNVQQETWVVGAECNNCTWRKSGIRSVSSHGLIVNGNVAALKFVGCNVEGIDTPGKAGIYLAPPTGSRVVGVDFTGGYAERIKGSFLETAGTDANSVAGLVVKGNQIYGGRASLSFVAGDAEYGMVLANVAGFDISENEWIDWELAAIFRSGSEHNGRVHNNTTSAAYPVTALTQTSNQFTESVDARNNFAGRKVESAAAMPTTGSYTQGDYVENRTPSKDGNSMILKGWIRLTTGSAHVLGTDWGRDYASHVTPAT